MSVRNLSPTANLLRTSRLFSLPPQLRRPVSELGFAANATSDTATPSYPVRATIETSESGLARGDWGLKRPLPLKSTTKSSTPSVYIENIDSIDHITDFGSAAPHARTLEKWQETDLSFSKHTQDNKAQLRSAFESEYDNTDRSRGFSNKERWRFDGPWLGNQSDRDFSRYLHRIRDQAPEFREFMRRVLSVDRMNTRKEQLRRQGEGEDAVMAAEQGSRLMTDEDLNQELKQLREQPRSLDRYISRFLDLPLAPDPNVKDNPTLIAEGGPPTTHPSAGLSYQRSHSHTSNHPLFGPQENKAPFEGRVLLAQRDAKDFERPKAIFGIGGVVCEDQRRTFSDRIDNQAIAKFNPKPDGGTRVWRQLRKATITPQGHIDLVNQQADDNALLAKGVGGQTSGSRPPRNAIRTTNVREMERLDQPSHRRSPQGFGLEDSVRLRPAVQPLEKGDGAYQLLRGPLKGLNKRPV